MIVGILELRVSVFDAMSLKDKRRSIKSLRERIGNKFNVSIAEVGHNDSIRTAILGVSMVANERRFVDSALSRIVEYVRAMPKVSLVDYRIETI